MDEDLLAETGRKPTTAQEKLWPPSLSLKDQHKNRLVLVTNTLLLLVLVLCPFIILGGVILVFYVFARFPGLSSVVLGVFGEKQSFIGDANR